MAIEYFVKEHSIVRQILGNSDTILFIFAGASAEFVLNKAVDWLYFTGRLPADPIGRLFSTVAYARRIVFSQRNSALQAIDSITAIHAGVEAKREDSIPQWAYRDVLFMLIDYSIRFFELLERELIEDEKQDVFNVFHRVGQRMGIKGLPGTFHEWEKMRQEQMEEDLKFSQYTKDFFRQYCTHLGPVRYRMLIENQKLLLPPIVKDLLGYENTSYIHPLLSLYKWSRIIRVDMLIKALLLPSGYKKQFKALGKYRASAS